jgi:hypothetical protein
MADTDQSYDIKTGRFWECGLARGECVDGSRVGLGHQRAHHQARKGYINKVHQERAHEYPCHNYANKDCRPIVLASGYLLLLEAGLEILP